MKKNNLNNLILILLITLLFLYITNVKLVTESILDYTNLFIEKLFPVSFLFFTISNLLIDFKLIEKIENKLKINSSILYVLLISLISGCPSGAKNTKELLDRGLISEKTANYLITFTHFPNPLFILGTSTTLFSNNHYPILILVSIIISNLLIAIITYKKEDKINKKKTLPQPTFSTSLSTAIISSLKTLILIYGTSIFFVIIFKIMTTYIKLPLYEYIFFNGLFDLTEGVYKTILLKSEFLRSLYIIVFIAIGSFSIHMQVNSIISNSKIQYKNFLKGRIISTILSILIFIILNFLI